MTIAPLQFSERSPRHRVAELFAGVGGFHLGLRPSGWEVVWANQWEPSTKSQPAADCYRARFPAVEFVGEDIATVLDRAEADPDVIPDHELLVGGFPCQDYSVAKTLNQAAGIEGKKGVLWWQIHRLLRLKRPPLLFLENVDRLLKSPATQRGRDFAIMLASLSDLGYQVEWRVVNAADYGFPQKRRRVYLVGRQEGSGDRSAPSDPAAIIYHDGVLARALPVKEAPDSSTFAPDLDLLGDLAEITERFRAAANISPFLNAGYMSGRHVWSRDVRARYDGPRKVLRDILEPPEAVPPKYYVPESQLDAWRYLKGAKKEQRFHRSSGTPYFYVEGPIPFPDDVDGPARTILTGEGGATPSRFKHIIATSDGRFRRLTPLELERLDGFPDGHTETGMSDGRRAFCMGNALVVGIIRRIGAELMASVAETEPELAAAVAS